MEDIKEAVLAVLPSIPEDKVQMLLNNLASIGVESKSDLQFIKEEDLLANITPIQCRRLLSAWQTLGVCKITWMCIECDILYIFSCINHFHFNLVFCGY